MKHLSHFSAPINHSFIHFEGGPKGPETDQGSEKIEVSAEMHEALLGLAQESFDETLQELQDTPNTEKLSRKKVRALIDAWKASGGSLEVDGKALRRILTDSSEEGRGYFDIIKNADVVVTMPYGEEILEEAIAAFKEAGEEGGASEYFPDGFEEARQARKEQDLKEVEELSSQLEMAGSYEGAFLLLSGDQGTITNDQVIDKAVQTIGESNSQTAPGWVFIPDWGFLRHNYRFKSFWDANEGKESRLKGIFEKARN